MTETYLLRRLLDLRTFEERRAQENAELRAQALRSARRKANEARSTLSQRAARAQEDEQSALVTLLGQRVKVSDIDAVRLQFDAAERELDQLRQTEIAAQSDAAERAKELTRAHDTLQERQRQVAKLDHLVRREMQNLERRRMAFTEADEEDLLIGVTASMVLRSIKASSS